MKELIRKAVNSIVFHEGYKARAYQDTKGIWTIGVGHNIESNLLPNEIMEKYGVRNFDEIIEYFLEHDMEEEDIRIILEEDVKRAIEDIQRSSIRDVFEELPQNVQIALIDFMFNVGPGTFEKFKRTINYIKNKDFQNASREIRHSRWCRQVGRRCSNISYLLALEA